MTEIRSFDFELIFYLYLNVMKFWFFNTSKINETINLITRKTPNWDNYTIKFNIQDR